MTINNPDLWKHLLPRPAEDSHKYQRGHALVHGAVELVGATHLAASACSRIGAGLTTVIAPEKTEIYQSILPPDIMVRGHIDVKVKNVSAILTGPGGATKEQIDATINNTFGAICILDANAIPVSNNNQYPKLKNPTILTPHEGEFSKAFPFLTGERLECAIAAAKFSKAIVVLKGRHTIIADLSGRYLINDHASPWLAKAGTGDVLAGMITGLAAQSMGLFEACAAACWIHGEAGLNIGPGLIASDIEKSLANILKRLLS